MRYDYRCCECGNVIEVEKRMSAPGPDLCKKCDGKMERYFAPDQIPSVLYPNRPPWTYKEAKKYKTAKHNDGPRIKIDPSKHGDLGSWNCDAEIVPEKPKRK